MNDSEGPGSQPPEPYSRTRTDLVQYLARLGNRAAER